MMSFLRGIVLLITLIHVSHADYASSVHNLFTSIKRDIEPMKARVNGTIPSWLTVDRYANGFGKFEGGEGKNAWKWAFLFDVTAYVLKWTVRGNEVNFVAKVTNSTYRKEGESHIPLFRTFAGTIPGMSVSQKIHTMDNFEQADNYNVNIVQIGANLLSISDMTGMKKIDPDTLTTLGNYNYTDDISKEKIAMITCAHPTKLPFDKYVYNYIVNMVPQNLTHMYNTQFFRIDSTKEPLSREIVYEEYSNSPPPYMHQFANTENYLVLFEYPLWWHELKIPFGTKVLPHMEWNPSLSKNGTKVKVIDKRTWKLVKTYYTDPFFAYHHVNAWEDGWGGELVVDIMTVPCETPTGTRIHGQKPLASCLHMNAFNMETLTTAGWDIPRGSLRRFHVPTTAGGDIKYEDLNHYGMDLYAIHPALKGKQHRYVWSMGNHGDASHEGVWWNSILKIDLKTNRTLEWYKEDHFPSEVSFIPRPGAWKEDDGVLISTVLGAPLGKSYLLVLDAATLEEIATADAPEFLPFPSHGHSCAPIKGQNVCFWG